MNKIKQIKLILIISALLFIAGFNTSLAWVDSTGVSRGGGITIWPDGYWIDKDLPPWVTRVNMNNSKYAPFYPGPIKIDLNGGGVITGDTIKNINRQVWGVDADAPGELISRILAPIFNVCEFLQVETLAVYGVEMCSNLIDDDADYFVDCVDPDCFNDIQCYEAWYNNIYLPKLNTYVTTYIGSECNLSVLPNGNPIESGIDKNQDGIISCQKSGHWGENCAVGDDEDLDGAVDCADSDCYYYETCRNLRNQDSFPRETPKISTYYVCSPYQQPTGDGIYVAVQKNEDIIADVEKYFRDEGVTGENVKFNTIRSNNRSVVGKLSCPDKTEPKKVPPERRPPGGYPPPMTKDTFVCIGGEEPTIEITAEPKACGNPVEVTISWEIDDNNNPSVKCKDWDGNEIDLSGSKKVTAKAGDMFTIRCDYKNTSNADMYVSDSITIDWKGGSYSDYSVMINATSTGKVPGSSNTWLYRLEWDFKGFDVSSITIESIGNVPTFTGNLETEKAAEFTIDYNDTTIVDEFGIVGAYTIKGVELEDEAGCGFESYDEVVITNKGIPPKVDITATPIVLLGNSPGSTLLEVFSVNAVSCTVDWKEGSIPVKYYSEDMQISESKKYTYSASCEGSVPDNLGNKVSDSVEVLGCFDAEIIDWNTIIAKIGSENKMLVTWVSINASSCTLNGEGVGLSGSKVMSSEDISEGVYLECLPICNAASSAYAFWEAESLETAPAPPAQPLPPPPVFKNKNTVITFN
jgi:hypothetical protein